MTDGGAKQDAHITDFMTHLVTGEDPNENDVGVVKDIYEKPVVTQRWVILSVKCGKQLPYPLFMLLLYIFTYVHEPKEDFLLLKCYVDGSVSLVQSVPFIFTPSSIHCLSFIVQNIVLQVFP